MQSLVGNRGAGKGRDCTMAKRKATSTARTRGGQQTPKPKKRSPRKTQPKELVTATNRSGAARPPIEPSTIRLVAGKGSPDRGGGPGGHYWHVYTGNTRAGHVYINVIDEEPFGKHASIQIQVNKSLQGRGVGKVAYRMACEQSRHDIVFAHMRKSNIASQKAAAAAGFVVVNDPAVSQLAMRWNRQA